MINDYFISKGINVNSLTYGKMQNSLHLVSECSKRLRNSVTASNSTDTEDDEEQVNDFKNDETNIKIAKVLIEAGCNLNHRDFHLHETPIFKAILQNDYKLVKLFIIEGIDYSLRNIFGNDALSRSIQLGRFKIARLLVDVDAPIRKSTCFYKMPRNDELNGENYSIEGGNHENMLMLSLENYEVFLKYLKIYTHDKV